jgi:hypothetical protein
MADCVSDNSSEALEKLPSLAAASKVIRYLNGGSVLLMVLKKLISKPV